MTENEKRIELDFLTAVKKLLSCTQARYKARTPPPSLRLLEYKTDFGNLFEKLTKGYSYIGFSPCIYIDFSKNPIFLKKYIIFADNPIHNFMYAINIKHNYVCAIDEDGDVVYYCAQDFNSFISATTVLVEDEANLCLNNLELDFNQRNIRATLCANLAGGEKYKQFYEFLYCVDINE